jgi:hypothetical protein
VIIHAQVGLWYLECLEGPSLNLLPLLRNHAFPI